MVDMKAKKSNKEPEVEIDLSFDEAMELICNTPAKEVTEAMKKEKAERAKKKADKKS
jgi:hypothetical protein